MEETAVYRLLIQVLEEYGIPWKREDGFVRFLVQRDGMRWEVNCLCRGGSVELYGRYPFRVSDRAAALEACGEINIRLRRGAMILPADGRPVLRDYVELDDAYGAVKRLRTAFDAHFRAMAWFWSRMEETAAKGSQVRRETPVPDQTVKR